MGHDRRSPPRPLRAVVAPRRGPRAPADRGPLLGGRGVDALVAHPAARFSGPARLARPARRIASLLPSATEILAALGLSDRLVAVTHECDFPPEVVAGLPRLTSDRAGLTGRSGEIDAAVRTALSDGHGLYRLDDALLANVAPDLILTQELCSVCAVSYPTVLAASRAAGGGDAPLVVSLEPHTLADVFATIRLVAELAGVDERGGALVADLERRLAAVPAPARRSRLALVEWLDPLFAPGHWVPDQIAAAGAESVLGSAGARSVQADWADVAAVVPDVVVLGLCGFDLPRTLEEWSSFEAPAALRGTPAWRSGEVWAMDGSAYVSRPGPRLVDGVEVLASIIDGRADPRAIRLPT